MTDRPEQSALLFVEVPREELPRVKCRGDCGHWLTDPQSQAIGWGPECLDRRFPQRRGEIEQDVIPGV
jgi:hypothetical protein